MFRFANSRCEKQSSIESISLAVIAGATHCWLGGGERSPPGLPTTRINVNEEKNDVTKKTISSPK
ncbi:MAG: hypothetical protein P8M80_07765, partial [Pirellulaceae bacterium]|nr:hypothetical protein [Pirellulaceae bacterium]